MVLKREKFLEKIEKENKIERLCLLKIKKL